MIIMSHFPFGLTVRHASIMWEISIDVTSPETTSPSSECERFSSWLPNDLVTLHVYIRSLYCSHCTTFYSRSQKSWSRCVLHTTWPISDGPVSGLQTRCCYDSTRQKWHRKWCEEGKRKEFRQKNVSLSVLSDWPQHNQTFSLLYIVFGVCELTYCFFKLVTRIDCCSQEQVPVRLWSGILWVISKKEREKLQQQSFSVNSVLLYLPQAKTSELVYNSLL